MNAKKSKGGTKMKKILKNILPGLLLITLATPGFAENRQGAYTISPFIGGYVLDHDQREESRPIFGLRAGYNFTRNLGAEVMFGYCRTETQKKYGSRETDLYRYGFDILYHFMPDNNLVPFIAIGGGGASFTIPDTPSAKNHYAGLFNYGVGLKYFVSDNVALRGDVRHVVLHNDLGDNNLEYSVGLTFQFGGEKKAVAAVSTAAVTKSTADTTAPAVVFTSPVDGATAVPVNQKVNIAFSEEMDPATITGESFTLKQGKTPLSGRLTTTGSNTTFTPASDLEKDKTYTATITTGAKDRAGNALASNYEWGFTTGLPADTTAPTVTFTSPVDGEKAAPVNQKVNVAFSEEMDPATITAATFTVKQGTTPVAGKVTSGASTAMFTPAKKFENGKAYTATVTTGAKDRAGNAMASNYAWNFTAFAPPKGVPCVLATLEDSHFEFDSSKIAENGKTILKLNVTTLQGDPKMKILVAGYTSASGSTEYNQKLSERRAVAVKEYLVKEGGIDGNRITTIGYGKTRPAKHEAVPSDIRSDAAHANMRVLIEIIEE
jgi:outer membrane beta-barrel protein